MNPSAIDPRWPNALRWFLSQRLDHFTPWHFISGPDELNFAELAFEREDVNRRRVFAFARRQDCDDFAGLEICGGVISDRVVCFHPVFGGVGESPPTWNICDDEFDDVFDFVGRRIIPDMKDWALVADASELDDDASPCAVEKTERKG